MKYGADRIRINCYDEGDNKCCSIVVGTSDRLYICEGNGSGGNKRKLEVSEHELYYLLKEFLDTH